MIWRLCTSPTRLPFCSKLIEFGFRHNGAALSVIRAAVEALPKADSIAYFDTAFHATIPAHISTYMLDQDIAKKRGLRKYGFHGLSCTFSSPFILRSFARGVLTGRETDAYILRTISQHLSLPPSQTNLIVLHLGSGASVCAIQNGQSLDTSMGLTPVSGLPGATRAGDIDGSAIFHYLARNGDGSGSGNDTDEDDVGRMSHEKLQGVEVHVTRAEEILNKQSGWKSLTGTTDFGTIVKRRNAALGKEREKEEEKDGEEDLATLAYDIFVDRLLTFVGSYYVKLGGRVDALVFAGGIGERSVEVRESVVRGAACLGFEIDQEKNQGVSKVRKEGGESVKVVNVSGGGGDGKKVLVCWTDEQVCQSSFSAVRFTNVIVLQLEMARECTLEKRFWS